MRSLEYYLVAEWIHFTLLGRILTHYNKTESVHFLGLVNSATKIIKNSEPSCRILGESFRKS